MNSRISRRDAANLLSGLDLGSSVAESDNLLEEARVETSVFDDLMADRVDLIPGTKGSGKTALYRIIVDFLPDFMLKNRKVVIAHGVHNRGDAVFLAYKEQFDQLTEADFVDFWCIYFMSLSYEQFLKAPRFSAQLDGLDEPVKAFLTAYRKIGIPDLAQKEGLREVIGWVLSLLSRIKPSVKWKPPHDMGQFELELGLPQETPRKRSPQSGSTAVLPSQVEAVARALEAILARADLSLWLMVDRLDELFARRSETEKRALRGLLRAIPLFASPRIRLKVFLRDDILEHIVSGEGFTGLTHVTARSADTLRWTEDQILTMIVRRLFANASVTAYYGVDKARLKTSIDYQRELFYRVFQETVHRPPNQSATLRWIYNHTKDGRGVVTPRDVIELVTRASQRQRDLYRGDAEGMTDRLIAGEAVIYGYEELSRTKRTKYLEAEFQHLWPHIRKLIGGGSEYAEGALRRILGRSGSTTIEDLVSIGVLARSSHQRQPSYRVPFLYRKGLECTQRYVAS